MSGYGVNQDLTSNLSLFVDLFPAANLSDSPVDKYYPVEPWRAPLRQIHNRLIRLEIMWRVGVVFEMRGVKLWVHHFPAGGRWKDEMQIRRF